MTYPVQSSPDVACLCRHDATWVRRAASGPKPRMPGLAPPVPDCTSPCSDPRLAMLKFLAWQVPGTVGCRHERDGGARRVHQILQRGVCCQHAWWCSFVCLCVTVASIVTLAFAQHQELPWDETDFNTEIENFFEVSPAPPAVPLPAPLPVPSLAPWPAPSPAPSHAPSPVPTSLRQRHRPVV